jgi:hypothetical protein
MVVNQILNVRGWLPAGLVLNTLLDTASRGDGKITCVPVLATGSSKSSDLDNDPSWIKVPQANASWAIQLRGKFLTPALLGALKGREAPLPEDPCVLLANVMFDGEVMIVSGEELAISRIAVPRSGFVADLYSYYAGLESKDVVSKQIFAGAIMPEGAASIVVTDPDKKVTYIDASPISYALPGEEPVLAYTAKHASVRYMTFVGTGTAFTEQNYGSRLDVVSLEPSSPTESLPEGIKAIVLRPTAADTIVTIDGDRKITDLPTNDWPAKGGVWARISQDISVIGTSC